MQAMQSEGTMTAMNEPRLLIDEVWEHYPNMRRGIDELEIEAYLHGLLRLPVRERDCVAPATNWRMT